MEKEMIELEITAEQIKSRIYTIRGVQVMLDYDLAQLFQVGWNLDQNGIYKYMRH